jgi:threonyl-tRNA synthetase
MAAPLGRFVLSPSQAKERMKNQPYKLELIEELEKDGESISFLRNGRFSRFVRGAPPHDAGTHQSRQAAHQHRTLTGGAAKKTKCCRAFTE